MKDIFNKKYLEKSGLIAWMASHAVAANLLMLVFIFGGYLLYTQSTQEVFPEFDSDTITISMSYPGASPAEVEQGIVLVIEDVLADIDGLGEMTSRAGEGSANISVEVLETDNILRISQDIKTAVDRINSFPVDAENLSVKINSRRREVISLALFADVDPFTLRKAAEIVLDQLEQDKQIGPVELSGARNFEIHIEITKENLEKYALNIESVSQKIKQIALEMGAGSIDSTSGEILIKVSERRDRAFEFNNIPIISQPDGSKVLLGQIASITEGFDDSNRFTFFEGKPAIFFDIYRVGSQTPIEVATAAKNKIETIKAILPSQFQLAAFDDRSELFAQRAELLIKNGLLGLMLVVLFLAIFLDVRLAFWVSLGIPVSFLGAFLLFPATDFTINIITMFAFIIALGIVVDDAILSGENIYSYRERGLSPIQAAIAGAKEIAVPICISVFTNMLAFIPLLFVPGQIGKVFGVIPVVVISIFFISLIESLFVLPAHLSFKKSQNLKTGFIHNISAKQKVFHQSFDNLIKNRYVPFINYLSINHRYTAFTLFIAALIVVIAYIASGRMGMTLFPRIESDYAFSSATLKLGSPIQNVQLVHDRLVNAAREVIDENGAEQLSRGIRSNINENQIQIRAYLTHPDIRPISTTEFTNQWRNKVGEISGLENLSFLFNRGGPGSGAALTIEMSHQNSQVLDQVAGELAAALTQFPNTKDIDDGSAKGKTQYDFKMKDLGYTLGFSTQEVARQVRYAFYGSEVLKQQRNRNEVKVIVRLPKEQRSSYYYLHNFKLKAPNGSDVLLKDVVEITQGRAYTAINRRDAKRVIQVQADVDPPSEANTVINDLNKDILPKLQAQHPSLQYSFEGRQAEIRDSLSSLFIGLICVVFVIYFLLAVLFSSYAQPLMVLITIPFGMVGAFLGHLIMGYSFSVPSMFGIIALAGVVVNNSLVLVEFINRKRQAGVQLIEAITSVAAQRFRPIILTTLTTFLGLAPMMLETSRQARFLIPMAISLGFGILFATIITLVFVPALYMITEDLKKIFAKKQVKEDLA